jgi:hypothetical protein
VRGAGGRSIGAAADRRGGDALCSTAGVGFAPPEFLRDTDAHDAAIEAILAQPPSTSARFAPTLEEGGQQYRLIAAPQAPVDIDRLPPGVAATVRRLSLPQLRFAELDLISDEQLQQA